MNSGLRHFLFLGALFSAACGSEANAPTEPPYAIPTAISIVSGNNQVGDAGAVAPTPLTVHVRSATGPAAGVAVIWEAATGNGSLSATATTTDAQGNSLVQWTLGTLAGNQKVVARVGALSIELMATANAGAAAKLVLPSDSLIVGRDPGADTATTRAQVTDRYDNPLSPAPVVAWSVADTSIARINIAGLMTGLRPGRTTISAATSGLAATRPVVVRLQMNARCNVPTSMPTRGSVAAASTFAPVAHSIRGGAAMLMTIPLDADGDGDSDVLALSSDDPETVRRSGVYRQAGSIWRNDGQGNFVDATAQMFGGTVIRGDYPRHYEVFDFTGDGRLDVFVGQHGDESPLQASQFPGAPNLLVAPQGNGTVRDIAPTALNPYDTKGYTHGMAGGDVDCDGDVDVFESNWINTKPHLQINQGGGVFRAEDTRLPPDVRQAAWPWQNFGSGAMCDVDRDGDNDMVLGGAGSGRENDRYNRLLYNNGFGTFYFAPTASLPLPQFGVAQNEAVEVRCGDVDLDGWNDVVISSVPQTPYYDRANVQLLLNNQNGTFRDATSKLPQSWTSGWARRVFLIDLNRDGWLDLVASGDGIQPRLFINRGNADFTEYVMPAYLGVDLRWANFHPFHGDTDGRVDLLSDNGLWLRNTGP